MEVLERLSKGRSAFCSQCTFEDGVVLPNGHTSRSAILRYEIQPESAVNTGCFLESTKVKIDFLENSSPSSWKMTVNVSLDSDSGELEYIGWQHPTSEKEIPVLTEISRSPAWAFETGRDSDPIGFETKKEHFESFMSQAATLTFVPISLDYSQGLGK